MAAEVDNGYRELFQVVLCWSSLSSEHKGSIAKSVSQSWKQ